MMILVKSFCVLDNLFSFSVFVIICFLREIVKILVNGKGNIMVVDGSFFFGEVF